MYSTKFISYRLFQDLVHFQIRLAVFSEKLFLHFLTPTCACFKHSCMMSLYFQKLERNIISMLLR